MKAFIPCAGLGSRMGSLTVSTPKPLLPLAGVPLIFYTLYQLWRWHTEFAVINVHYLGEQIKHCLRHFSWFELAFSPEERLLGTAGGIRNALPLFESHGPEREIVILNPDALTLTGEPLPALPETATSLLHVLERGDEPHAAWDLAPDGLLLDRPSGNYFYSGYSLLRLELLRPLARQEVAELGPLWRREAREGRLLGRLFKGLHLDLGDEAKYRALQDLVLPPEKLPGWDTFLRKAL
ncbi:MAG: NTP transferase domain-containing protein [Spirochaetales bacterium]|nr:NTP transferase domain-containing protein [Spirochaetales bacterium]